MFLLYRRQLPFKHRRYPLSRHLLQSCPLSLRDAPHRFRHHFKFSTMTVCPGNSCVYAPFLYPCFWRCCQRFSAFSFQCIQKRAFRLFFIAFHSNSSSERTHLSAISHISGHWWADVSSYTPTVFMPAPLAPRMPFTMSSNTTQRCGSTAMRSAASR